MVSGSSTITVEPGAYKTSKSSTHDIQSPLSLPKIQPVTISDGQSIPLEPIGDGALPDPNTAAVRLARWNHPRINMYRVLATFYSFVILGLNDSAYGAIIPYLETYYNVNYTIISLIFLSPNLGYFTAAITNNMLHVRFGQRGIAALMSLSHVFAYLVISLHPPFPVLVVVFVLAGFGNGIGDGAW
jgi:fucose permease